jgi:predicted RNA binding protein YcfA (HicA-like mRNA interferase family)
VSDRLPRIEGRVLVRVLKKSGFAEVRWRGSHLHLYRASDKKNVIVPVHAGEILAPGTLAGILKDAALSADQLRRLQ